MCIVWFIRWVWLFICMLFILFLILDFGVRVVIELIMIRFIVFECISVFMIFSVCLLVLGWLISSLFRLMFSLWVYCGLSVCLVLIKV